jgi:hypothetical protein
MVVPVFVNLVLIPRYVCKIVGLSFSTYLLNGCLKACVFSVPLAAGLLVFHHFFPLKNWAVVLIGCASGSCIYLLTLLTSVLANRDIRFHWMRLDTLEILKKNLLRRKEKDVGATSAVNRGIFDELREEQASTLE